MVFIRKRYYFWLLKAYIKKWKRIILTSILLGVALFFTILIIFTAYVKPVLDRKVEKIGFAGTFTLDDLPQEISSQISFGLTKVDIAGNIKPGASAKWEIKNSGKTYIFYLNKNYYFHNGEKLTSKNLNLNFKDANKREVNESTVAYDLKEPYSPFLISVSKPIFLNNLSGLGDYKIVNVDLNAGFLRSITIQRITDRKEKKVIYFYPSVEALKTAFSLGEVDKITQITDLNFKNTNLLSWKNIKITKAVNYNKLYTVFYNNNDKNLSDKKLRQALNYALPVQFPQGERAYSPINPNSIFYDKNEDYNVYDLEIAKTFLGSENNINLELSVQKDNEDVAKVIKMRWEKLGIHTKIKIVEQIPGNYQALIFPFNTSANPDQYTLWHSEQTNNISHYDNKRIDKLLEDGRRIYDLEEKKRIYGDFQKYLLADTTASFLYYPYEYTIERVLR